MKVMDNVSTVTTNYGSGYAIKSDGTLWAWGYNGYGQLGVGDTVDRSAPVKVMDNVSTVTANDYFDDGSGYDYYGSGYAIKSDGTLWAWGYNGYGQLGVGDRVDRSAPVKVM